jgi:TRAP transporter 4TM/12TM fusion protein
MTASDAEANGQSLEEARHVADIEEGSLRRPSGWTQYLVPAIAICWCAFQLSIASWWILDAVFIRSMHLGFAILMVFFQIPMLKRSRQGRWAFLAALNRIPSSDVCLALLACFAALYIALDYAGLSGRMGAPLGRDIVVGAVLVLLLLEATRRTIGPALPCIAVAFSLYSFLGPHMPDFIAFKGVSWGRYMGQITMSTEGIYGIPLDVSATIVFLFVLFGSMLDQAGAGRYFIQLAICLLGRFKGGPAKAAILGSGLTGMVSGSSIANIVTTGTFTIPLMKRVGYPAKKAAAIEVAASTDGQLAPPIMGAAAFIIAEYVNVPYIEVVKAAAIPAFVSYAALFYITHLEASKLGLRGLQRDQIPQFWSTFTSGLHYLIPLTVLIYELLVMRHSPELAAFRAIVVLAIVILIQEPVRSILAGQSIASGLRHSLQQIFAGCIAGGRNMVGVAIATASAGIIVGVVTMGLGGLITDIIDTLSGGNIFLMLVITAIASLVLGMGLPTTATYIVLASLTAPAIVTIGQYQGFVIPLIAAHLFCFYFGILADDTPPVGLAAYAAAAIARSEPIPTGVQGFMYDIRTAILPFMFMFNTDLLLIGIDSWWVGLFIFSMSCVGAFAFASATQGWFAVRNRWYDVPLLLTVTLIMLRPGVLASWLGVDQAQRYWMYGVGLILFSGLYLWQRTYRTPL